MRKITVQLDKKYDIIISRGLLKDAGKHIADIAGSRRAVIITDDIVDGYYGDILTDSLKLSGFEVFKFVFENGERSKSPTMLNGIYDFLAEHNLSRNDTLIALGGGVVGDITGYAAATYLRGMRFVQIPTTLLAQVDSSVGGKTGINISAGKNLVGAFHQPSLVLCDVETLKTLSADVVSDGMGEVIKYGMIKSGTLFETLLNDGFDDNILDIISECIDIKRVVVQNDEFDTGERMILNFGHTLGHAIEKHTDFNISHGKAVAMGMGIITKLAESKGMCKPETYDKLVSCLLKYGLPHTTDIPLEQLYKYCLNDKKRGSDTITIVICNDTGSCTLKKIGFDEFKEFLS